MSRRSNYPQVRKLAQCIILSSQGFAIQELMKIFKQISYVTAIESIFRKSKCI